MGRAPIARMSRTIPPTPVAAPWYGSMADGWLCDSILKTAASPSPMSTTPAFSSPGRASRRGLSTENVRSSGFECLYPQCSLQSEPNSPSSRSFGSRPSRSTIASYSASDSARASSASLRTVMTM